MPFSAAASHFNENELRVLRQAYDMACAELGLDLSERCTLWRESVAASVIQIAVGGEMDPRIICSLVLSREDARRGLLPEIVP